MNLDCQINKSPSFAEEPGCDVRDWKRQPLTIGLGPGQWAMISNSYVPRRNESFQTILHFFFEVTFDIL